MSFVTDEAHYLNSAKQSISCAEFEQFTENFPREAQTVVMFNQNTQNDDDYYLYDGRDIIGAGGMEAAAMTYAEAMAALVPAQSVTGEAVGAPEALAGLFLSCWLGGNDSQTLTFQEDGTLIYTTVEQTGIGWVYFEFTGFISGFEQVSAHVMDVRVSGLALTDRDGDGDLADDPAPDLPADFALRVILPGAEGDEVPDVSYYSDDMWEEDAAGYDPSAYYIRIFYDEFMAYEPVEMGE